MIYYKVLVLMFSTILLGDYPLNQAEIKTLSMHNYQDYNLNYNTLKS